MEIMTHANLTAALLPSRPAPLGWLCCGVILLGALTPASAATLLSAFDDSLTNVVSGAPNGTIVGGVTPTTGKIGSYGLEFDGTGYVDTTNAGFPNSTAGLTTGSASFWIKTTTSAPSYVFYGASEAPTRNTLFGLRVNHFGEGAQTGNMSLWTRAKTEWPPDMYRVGMAQANNSWRDGDWHHVAMTWNVTTGSSGTGSASIFLDGVGVQLNSPVWNNITSSNTFLAYTSSLRIGAGALSDGTPDSIFIGALDDVAVWGGRLTDIEVLSLYNLGNDTVLNYNAADGSTLFDTLPYRVAARPAMATPGST